MEVRFPAVFYMERKMDRRIEIAGYIIYTINT